MLVWMPGIQRQTTTKPVVVTSYSKIEFQVCKLIGERARHSLSVLNAYITSTHVNIFSRSDTPLH